MQEFRKVDYDSFKYHGVVVHPPSAYTTGNAYTSHLWSVANELGGIYKSLMLEFPGYFRYTLYHLREDLFPSCNIAKAILNKKIAQNELL